MSRLIGFKATYLGFQSIIMPLWITLYVRYSPESGSECAATLLQSLISSHKDDAEYSVVAGV